MTTKMCKKEKISYFEVVVVLLSISFRGKIVQLNENSHFLLFSRTQICVIKANRAVQAVKSGQKRYVRSVSLLACWESGFFGDKAILGSSRVATVEVKWESFPALPLARPPL